MKTRDDKHQRRLPLRHKRFRPTLEYVHELERRLMLANSQIRNLKLAQLEKAANG